MSKIVYICYKKDIIEKHHRSDIEHLAYRLTPDNIPVKAPRIVEANDILIGVFNPVNDLEVKDTSVCLGAMLDHNDTWWEPESPPPDGAYTLFRGSSRAVEILSDTAASRTIWYVHSDQLFIASTSQRAIVYLLQEFLPNPDVYSWMLSSGTLGFGLSWDRRIKCLGPNTRLLLDRASWKMTINQEPVHFNELDAPNQDHARQLQHAMEETFAKLDLDFKNWVVPLSGGRDSRAILTLLHHRPGIRTVTWGLKSSRQDKRSDAYIARKVAEHYQVPNEYFETDPADEPVETIFNRFLIAGEGRVDHVGGYMDGFKVWRLLHERGVAGMLRGDHGYGRFSARSELDARRSAGVLLLSDYANLRTAQDYGLPPQELPEALQWKDETPAGYREKLHYRFRMPTMLGALNDLKYCYVEVISPFLSRTLFRKMNDLPVRLRTDKKLHKQIVEQMGPRIRFAAHASLAPLKTILASPKVSHAILDELSSQHAKNVLPAALLNQTTSGIDSSLTKASKKREIAKLAAHLVPGRIKMRMRKYKAQLIIDPNVLAFRAYLICRMHHILNIDAQALSQRKKQSSIETPV